MNIKTRKELERFMTDEVVSTAEAATMMGCTRQYIYKLVKANKLTPIKVLGSDRLFLKQDIVDKIKQ